MAAQQNKCVKCNEPRHYRHFSPEHKDTCLFCVLEDLYAQVSKAESRLNSTVPPGRSVQQVCPGCQTLNWWINLEPLPGSNSSKRYCVACRFEHAEYLKRIQDGVSRFDEQGKLSAEALDDLLKGVL